MRDGDHELGDLAGKAILIADGYLSLSIGTKFGDGPRDPKVIEALRQVVRGMDREGHSLRRLVTRVAEHQSLITGSSLGHHVRNVWTLRLHEYVDGALVGEAEDRIGVTKVTDDTPRHRAKLLVMKWLRGGVLAGDHEPVPLARVSMAQRTRRGSGSLVSRRSRMASLTWSHTLSGCPAATDSDVNR